MRRAIRRWARGAATAMALLGTSVGCSFTPATGEAQQDGDDGNEDDDGVDKGLYAFSSRFLPGQSSVAYTGQAARHLMIRELAARIERSTDDVLAGKTSAELSERLWFWWDFKPDHGGTPEEPWSVEPMDLPLLQQTVGEVGVASLRDKTRDQDNDDESPVIGWKSDDLSASAVAQDMMADLVTTWTARQTAGPEASMRTRRAAPYVSEAGIDYRALLEQYLLGAVVFSQSCDDYLDDKDGSGNGLFSDNVDAVDGKPYTVLEHAWDEGFGYFGAARAFATASLEENAAGVLDVDGDGKANWLTEVNYGHARRAAQLDLASASGTHFSRDAFVAFREGRRLITQALGALSADDFDALVALRDQAIASWEKAMAADVISTTNQLMALLEGERDGDDDFVRHAQLWSKLKGSLLALQFNPRSPFLVDLAAYRSAHALVQAAPRLERTRFAEARADLLSVRNLVQATYGFEDDDVASW